MRTETITVEEDVLWSDARNVSWDKDERTKLSMRMVWAIGKQGKVRTSCWTRDRRQFWGGRFLNLTRPFLVLSAGKEVAEADLTLGIVKGRGLKTSLKVSEAHVLSQTIADGSTRSLRPRRR